MNAGANPNIAAIGSVLVALAALAVVAVLTWHGSITGEAAVGILGTIIGGGAVGGAVHVGVRAGARAARNEGGY